MIEPVFDQLQKEKFYEWISPRADIEVDDYTTIGFVDGEQIVGVILFCNYDGNNIYVHIAAEYPGAVQRKFIRLMFDYIFNQAKCQRVTATCLENKKRSQKLIEGVGFKKEGLLKNFVRKDDTLYDIIIYGMQKEDCKWVTYQ